MKVVDGWLKELGLAQYAEAFAENGIDAALLPELNNEDLKDLGVARLADRKRLLKAIEELTPGSRTDATRPLPAATPDGEHRQVTVLFADIAGFTRLTSELGAEEIHTLLNRYFEAVDAILLSYGGSVDKHIGDNVMAVFGAPIAHDDDPFRAVRAAFEIHERVRGLSDQRGRPLQVHIGIASGQVVASGTGSDSHREYTVTGDSVNLAARLQDKAAAGETLISDALRRAIADRVECKDMGEVEVKGIERPVRIWKVEVLRASDGPLPRVTFVGREAELAQLAGAVDACRASGSGRAIVVRGEAGIGKTRLVEEFTRMALANGFKLHRGLVLDFGVGEGRDAIRAVVHSLLGIPAGSDKATRQSAADATIANGLLEPEQRIFLSDLLGLPQSPEDLANYDAMTNTIRNNGKRTAIADLLRAVSAEQPLAVIIEDIHWADPLSLAHLARMAATFADCPGLLVMTSRVEGYPLDQAWRSTTGGCPFMTLDLGPLRRQDSIKLAGTFLDMTKQLALNCVQRAEGNPLFLEQLLRNVREHGDGEVPASIQSLVLARIDRLPPADKLAVQAASVLGQRFALDALRHLIATPGYDCRGLIQRSLVRPEGDDYLFDHALVQEGVAAWRSAGISRPKLGKIAAIQPQEMPCDVHRGGGRLGLGEPDQIPLNFTNVSIGTIFGIYPSAEDGPASVLRPARHLLASGYIIYGPQCCLMLRVGEGATRKYVLDPDSDRFCDLYADRTSAATMAANQLRLWFASMAYVLLCALRRIGLAHTELETATCGSIRLKLLQIGALARVSVRRVKVAMASAHPCQHVFALAHAPIMHRGLLGLI